MHGSTITFPLSLTLYDIFSLGRGRHRASPTVQQPGRSLSSVSIYLVVYRVQYGPRLPPAFVLSDHDHVAEFKTLHQTCASKFQ